VESNKHTCVLVFCTFKTHTHTYTHTHTQTHTDGDDLGRSAGGTCFLCQLVPRAVFCGPPLIFPQIREPPPKFVHICACIAWQSFRVCAAHRVSCNHLYLSPSINSLCASLSFILGSSHCDGPELFVEVHKTTMLLAQRNVTLR